MELTFSQVESVFVERFAIDEHRVPAFRGRLQHLQRLHFPQGINTGRGRKAAYGWRQIIQLMVALDLIDLGLAPETVIERVRANSDKLIDAIDRIVGRLGSPRNLAKAISKGRCSFGDTELVVTSSAALTISQGGAARDAYLFVMTGREFTSSLTEDPGAQVTQAYFDLGARTMFVAGILGRKFLPDAMTTAADLTAWLDDYTREEIIP